MLQRLSPLIWLVVVLAAAACSDGAEPAASEAAASPAAALAEPITTIAPITTTQATTTTTTTTTVPPVVGAPHGNVEGLTMFRGNPTRTYYGTGPIPTELEVLWRFPDAPMCGVSSVGGEPKQWCGSGWTGQPVVWERPDGITEVIFGAYDKHIHFLDAATGERTRPDFFMGDIIKGSVTLDPDGYPLLYSGSRDPSFKIIALDRETPTELWSLDAASVPGMWNNDWDSNPVIVDGIMYQGGENSWWYAVELNRDYDDDGLVTLDPEIVFDTPAFSDESLVVGRQQSIENSTAVFEGRAFFANSAGRVVGVDVDALPEGEAEIVFDYWVGDDVDASIVIDAGGALYVSAEVDHATARSAEIGQLVRLDPDNPQQPVVWGLAVPGENGLDGGIWATPALAGDVLYVPTNPGDLLAVDTATGDVVWQDDVGAHAWSSPVVIDGRMLVAVNCDTAAALRVYDVTDRWAPQRLTETPFAGGCIESTPAVWDGRVFVGSRDGFFYALGGSS